MSREEFIEIIADVVGAYPNAIYDKSQMDVWYKYLGGFDSKILGKVVTEYIMENSRPPAISDFYGRCKKISGLRLQVAT